MYKRWQESEIEYLRENYGIIPIKDLAKHFNTTISSVQHCAVRNDLKSARAWTDEELDFLKKNYKDMTYKELSAHLRRTKAAIDLKINRLGLVKSKYVYNKDFFEDITTEEQSYWCGFIMADGCVTINHENNSCELAIKLQQGDAGHLRKFNKSLGGNVPVELFTDYCNLTGKDSYQCMIRLYSEKMVHDIGKYGVVPHKTPVKQFPKNIPEELMWHFVRGYFDGNGCIVGSKDPKKYAKCSFATGSYDFANGLHDYLNTHGIHTSAVYRTHPDVKCWAIQIGGMQNVDNFLHKMYDNSNIYLDRKKRKKEQIYKHLNLDYRLLRRSEMAGSAI